MQSPVQVGSAEILERNAKTGYFRPKNCKVARFGYTSHVDTTIVRLASGLGRRAPKLSEDFYFVPVAVGKHD